MSNGYSLPIALAGGRPAIEFGTTVKVLPTITKENEIRLALSVEMSEPDAANGVTLNDTFVPGLTRRKVQSTVDIKNGQTLIVGGFVSTCPKTKQTKETFVTATVGIVQPYGGIELPLVLPVNVAPQPAPSLLLK